VSVAFQPTKKNLYCKNQNEKDPRLGDLCIFHEQPNGQNQYVIAGYPDDEGIKINNGRIGAKLGPDSIRQVFYKMTPKPNGDGEIFDIGNLETSNPIKDRHDEVRKKAAKTFKAKQFWMALGGGHDYGFADAAGFLDVYSSDDPLVINFDAHLDVRPTTTGLSSGTPFYRLLEEFEAFGFIEVGIQQQCNSQEHLQWCQSKGGEILCFEEILYSGQSLSDHFEIRFAKHLQKNRPTFLSIDIDGFSSSYAMGCSQAWPAGIEPAQFFPWLKMLKQKLNIRGIGIYEVSPPLDHDQRTAKLAAQIMHHFIY